MIILSWFMFSRDSGIVFIEEPELFIHAGLQKQLMSIFDKHHQSDKFQFFLATHSNHILDYASYSDNISIFSVTKVLGQNETEAKFRINYHSKPEIELLESLGVSNSSVFLSNCTIWVEGNTDWKYLRKLFEIYQSALPISGRFKENLHYCFLEYGGSLIAHWMFDDDVQDNEYKEFIEKLKAKNISNRILVIADKDDSRKKTKHDRLSRELKENYLILPCREIENILPLNTIIKIVNDIEGSDALHVERNNFNDYSNLKLGNYITKHILEANSGISRYKNYINKNGGKNGKQAFCNLALKYLDIDFQSFTSSGKVTSESVKNLIGKNAFSVCEKMYAFIKKNNSDNTNR